MKSQFVGLEDWKWRPGSPNPAHRVQSSTLAPHLWSHSHTRRLLGLFWVGLLCFLFERFEHFTASRYWIRKQIIAFWWRLKLASSNRKEVVGSVTFYVCDLLWGCCCWILPLTSVGVLRSWLHFYSSSQGCCPTYLSVFQIPHLSLGTADVECLQICCWTALCKSCIQSGAGQSNPGISSFCYLWVFYPKLKINLDLALLFFMISSLSWKGHSFLC